MLCPERLLETLNTGCLICDNGRDYSCREHAELMQVTCRRKFRNGRSVLCPTDDVHDGPLQRKCWMGFFLTW